MSRLLVLIVLLLATALSGTAEASLRAVGPVSQVVICADGAAVTLALDADGQPADTGGHRHCPDCLPLLTGATGPAPLPSLSRPVAGAVPAPWPAALPPRADGWETLPSPRGPPSGDLS